MSSIASIKPATEATSTSAVNLRTIVVTLYRRKWVVLALAIPTVLIGGIMLFNQSGSFAATARVLVELSNVDMPRWNVTGQNIDYDRELSTLLNIAMSVPVAAKAAESLEDSIPVIRDLDPDFAALADTMDLKFLLMSGTNVSVVGESRILEFQFNAPHPDFALMAVGAMRDAFVDYQIHGGKNTDAVAYYEEQIAIVRTQVDSLLSERSAILENAGYSEMREEMRAEAGHLANAEYELVRARSARSGLEIRYQGLTEALKRDPREFPMGEAESRASSVVYWRRLVGQHEEALNALLAVHTPTSSPVLQRQEQLSSALDNLRREEEAYVESVRIELEGARTNESMLANLVTEFKTRRQNAPQAFYKVSLVDAETSSLRELMEALQGKLGEVRISLQADERVSSVIALTDPALAPVISGGKTVVYFLMLVFFALAMGVIAAFVLEMIDHRISSPEEIEEHLNLPVVASITKAK